MKARSQLERKKHHIVPPIVHSALRSPGRPLDPDTRSLMESRFGFDFRRVRIHDDSRAAESADAVNAAAFTIGNRIVFGGGRYTPASQKGKQLIAHELAHVVQQSRTSAASTAGRHAETLRKDPPSIRRKTKSDDECGGGTCCSRDSCSTPDTKGGREATNWLMIVNIDIERGSFYSALYDQKFGHTYVKLMDNSGTEYTYGFYPAGELPNEAKPSVAGCVHHPDTTHSACIDEQVMYTLSQSQYTDALKQAQARCRKPPIFHAGDYNCTTFAGEIVRAAGQSLPPMRETVSIFYQSITADNPNTLLDNVRKERRRAPHARSPFWNNPYLNRCEAVFDLCVAKSRMGGMDCFAERSRCLRSCPPPS